MKVLVLNSGSSSIKYQLFTMPEEKVICSGLIERIGLEEGAVHYESANEDVTEHIKIQNQSETSFHVSNLFAKQEKNSFLNTVDTVYNNDRGYFKTVI